MLSKTTHALIFALGLLASSPDARAAAELLFEDDFNEGIPGWTAVQPPGAYIEGPMRWQFDIVSDAFVEHSNIYTGSPAGTTNATAVMLINDTVTGPTFTYKARLVAGDDDGFGLIFGYQNPTTFYRVTFSRQNRTGELEPSYPYTSWVVDQKVNDNTTNLFGWPTPGYIETFRNTQYQPFDVTITVSEGNLFSLTVVDDPDGLAIVYPLVENQPLPGPANGQVGLISWGMGGTALRGFRISNLELDPVDLTGNPQVLDEWTPVVTPRADGSLLDPATGNGGVPIWSLSLGQNGNFGTLQENSDAFGGNNPEGRVDFPAAALVAGDVNWDNYVFSTRIIPGDDDGYGILVRYQDEYNFYRIALRAQNSGSGVKRGVSIQKVVGGFWEEIFQEDTPQFIPATGVPFEISALMTDNRLQVLIIADPDGAATRYAYGPFELSGATIPNGKIGLFSWAMYPPVEFDWVRVISISGIPLQVSSAYGSPTPPVGLDGYAPGTEINASVESPVITAPGVRQVVTGWTGTGSVPVSGAESSVTFTLNEISSLIWEWATEIQVLADAGAGGAVTGVPGEWVPEGTELTLTAVPNEGFIFTGWSGTTASTAAALAFPLSFPVNLHASFAADSDDDSLPDTWEEQYFGDLAQTAAGDSDSDTITNLDEYHRGTNPSSAETLASEDGLSSPWINVQRDPVLPGQLIVRDFGNGFRGVWDNSNDFRSADDAYYGTNAVANVSFDGPRIIISESVWQPGWNDFTGSAAFSAGDNDGNCIYWRYQDENNWYRATITGEENNDVWRAKYGVTIQKKVDGVFTELADLPFIFIDTTDTFWYKRVRMTITAQGSNFELRVGGFNFNLFPPDWDPDLVIHPFIDEDLPTGRFGVGTWGQGGGNSGTPNNPVNAGTLIEDVSIEVGGEVVFNEDWEDVPLPEELPAGWENPYTEAQAGNWQVTAHGTILQSANYSTASTGTTEEPRGDGEGTILLAPAPDAANYFLELGFHPFDNDGIGFVYNYEDTNNYSRVMFVSEGSAPGRIPQGINISRKEDGVWSDLLLEDRSFIYTQGSPFGVEFANNNGQYRMRVWNLDDPSSAQLLQWTGPAPEGPNRFGFSTWGETDAHFLYGRAYALAGGPTPPGDVEVTSISVAGGQVTLTVSIPEGAAYAVEQSTTLEPGSWSPVAENQTETTWSAPLPQGSYAFWRIRTESANIPVP